MPLTPRCGAALAALTTVVLAVPAGASAAPTLALDRPCYTPDMPIGLSGTGYTPGGPLQASIGLAGTVHTFTGQAGPAGEIGGAIPLPGFDGDAIDATITAVDGATVTPGQPPGPEQTAMVPFRASPWAMIVPGWGDGNVLGTGRPGRMTRVRAIGFVGTASTTLYAHYVRRGRLVKTTRVGALTGPCADLDARFRQFPFKVKRGATYAVTFDTTRAWPNDDAGIFYPRVKPKRGGSIRALHTATPDRASGHR